MRTTTSTLRFLSVAVIGAIGVMGAGCGGGGGSKSDRNAATAGVQSSVIMTMSSARAEHSATLLPNGEVLVAGGVDISGAPTKTTVIIGLGAVRSGPDLAQARVGHSATLLTNGQVLVAGGSSDKAGATVLASSELFDPVTSTFAAGPALVQARTRHAAASYVRATGEFVVFAGGSAGQTAATPPAPVLLDSVEVLDVTQGLVQASPAKLASAQLDPRVARLDTGSILFVGGQAAAGPAAAQIFDPATQTFTASNVVVGRSGAAVSSRGREVLVAGGQSAIGLEDSTEIYDSLTNTFAQGARLGVKRADAAIASVGANDVVIVGGRGATGASNAVEKLSGANFGQATLTNMTSLASARVAHTATGISGTKFVVVGGYDAQGIPLATVEQIDLTAVPAPTTPAATTPGTTTPGITPGTTVTPGTTTPGTGTTTPPATGGLGGLLGGLFGGGSGSTSGSGGSGIGSTLLNAALNAAVSALTNNPGGGFSGFMSAFLQNFMSNAVTGLLGGSSTSGSTSGGLGGVLSSLLGSLTGGSSGSTSGSSGGISSLLSSLLGSLTGGSSGSTSGSSSGGLGGLLSGLFGGSSSGSGSSGGLGGLLSGLFGGGSSGSTAGSTGSTTPPASSTAPAITSMTPGQGPVGTSVVITGTNFGTTVGVRFNGTVVPAASMTATRNSAGVVTVTMPVPAGATTGMVTVSTNNQVVNAGNFTVQ